MYQHKEKNKKSKINLKITTTMENQIITESTREKEFSNLQLLLKSGIDENITLGLTLAMHYQEEMQKNYGNLLVGKTNESITEILQVFSEVKKELSEQHSWDFYLDENAEGEEISQAISLLSEMIALIEKGVVVVNKSGECFLCDEENQVFLMSDVYWSDGWINENGKTEKWVKKGEYYLLNDGNWDYEKAVWSKNQKCDTPFTLSDFYFRGTRFHLKNSQ